MDITQNGITSGNPAAAAIVEIMRRAGATEIEGRGNSDNSADPYIRAPHGAWVRLPAYRYASPYLREVMAEVRATLADPAPPTECSAPGCSAEAGPLPGPTSGRDLCPEHRDDERHELERTA